MTAYYNEIDRFAAAWLRALIAHGLIADGEVDERSIADVTGADVRSFAQVHLFAGIGGWSRALRLAGWPDERPVWTGSCPCQPFSAAGLRKGFADERHLWPEFNRLIAERRPAIVFGEQVAGRGGREWLHAVRSDLEALGYAVGAADLCAASVGAPHIRQRLWGVVDADGRHASAEGLQRGGEQRQQPQDGGAVGGVGNAEHDGSSAVCEPSGAQVEGRVLKPQGSNLNDFWSDAEWTACLDGKIRPTEPGIFPLAHGVSARVGKLRAIGNSIVPQVAAEFIKAYTGVG